MDITPQIAILTPEQIAAIVQDAIRAAKAEGDMPEKLWKVADVAEFLGVSEETVYKYTANGEIPCRKIGDRYIFHPAAMNERAAKKG